MSVNLKSLVGKLNDTTRSALEGAAGLCLSRTHYDIEVEHFLLKLLDATGSDVAAILKHYGIDRSRLATELSRSLDKLKTGNARTPAISPTVLQTLREAWSFGSLEYNASSIRSGYALMALVSTDELTRLVRDISKELQKIDPESLRKDFVTITSVSDEEDQAAEASEQTASA